MCLHSTAASLELYEMTGNVAALLVEIPRNSVGAVAVVAGVSREQTEGSPALVEVGSTGGLEAGYIV